MKTQKTINRNNLNYLWDGEVGTLKKGDLVTLISRENEQTNEVWYELRGPEGCGGNSDLNQKARTGWRGTTNGIRCEAHGLRKITRIRDDGYCGYRITVGPEIL